MPDSIKFLTVLIAACLVFTGLLGIVSAQDTEVTEANAENAADEAINLDENIQPEDLGIKDPKLLPDSAFYFLKNWGRGVQSFFTFDSVKKAELKLKFANEKLIEAKKVIKKNPSGKAVNKALEGYKKEIENLKKEVEKKNLKIDDPKVEKFLEKLTDQNFKQQKLLDKLEKEISGEQYEKIQEVKENALENITAASLNVASPEELKAKIEKIIEEQEGSKLKHIKNLEVLMRIEEKVPEKAKEAIQKAQANALKRLHNDFLRIPENEKPILKEYLEKIGGNEVYHLEIISNLGEEEVPSIDRKILEESKESVIKRVDKKLKEFKKEEEKENYLKHLKTGEITKLKVIKELENNLSPESVQGMIKIKTHAENELRERLDGMESSEAKEIFLKKIELKPTVNTFWVLEDMEEIIAPEKKEFLKEIEMRVIQNLEKKIETTATEDGKERIMEAMSAGSVGARKIIENLDLPANIKVKLKAIEIKKIENKIKQIEDPQRLEALREKIENEKIRPLIQLENFKILEEKIESKILQIGPEMVLKQIKKAEDQLAKAEEVIESSSPELIKKIKNILSEARKNYEEKKYREAYKNAVTASQMINNEIMQDERGKMLQRIENERTVKFEKGFPGISIPNVMTCPMPKKPECEGEVKTIRDSAGCVRFICKGINGSPSGSEDTDYAEKPDSGKKVVCPALWAPVCGKDGKTYSNECIAANIAKVKIDYEGVCKNAGDSTKNLSCWRKCASLGYQSGICRKWTVTLNAETGCKAGEANIGTTSDCCVSPGLVGIGKTCCCAKNIKTQTQTQTQTQIKEIPVKKPPVAKDPKPLIENETDEFINVTPAPSNSSNN